MIALLLAALQVAAADPSVLTVRAGAAEAVLPIVAGPDRGRAVRVDRIAAVIPLAVDSLGAGRYRLVVAGVELRITDHAPLMEIGGRVVPLASVPFLDEGRLYVPLQVLAEQLPQAAPERLRYNPVRGELRLLDGPAAVPAAGRSDASAGRAGGSAKGPRAVARPGRRWRVVVDAGHGGPDNGMTGPIGGSFDVREKEITLAVARRLETALRQRGVDVIMTRTTDTLIALSDRGRIANQRGGDVFVSVHVNAANPHWTSPAAARGFETYFLAEAKTEDARRVEQMENESVRFETNAAARKGDPLSFILSDMLQNEHLRESSALAEQIQARLTTMHPGPSRGVKQAGFRVLVTAFMPSVLVEIGFGTNPDEARYLSDPARQREIAEAVAGATVEYLTSYQRRAGVAGR